MEEHLNEFGISQPLGDSWYFMKRMELVWHKLSKETQKNNKLLIFHWGFCDVYCHLLVFDIPFYNSNW